MPVSQLVAAPTRLGQAEILLLEDYDFDAELVIDEIRRSMPDARIHTAKTKAAFHTALSTFSPNLILVDWHLQSFKGCEAIETARRSFPNIPYIVVSGSLDGKTSEQCKELGVFDYVSKDDLPRLELAVRNALALQGFRQQREKLKDSAKSSERRLKALFQKSGIPIVELCLPGMGELVAKSQAENYSMDMVHRKLVDLSSELYAVQSSEAALRLFEIYSQEEFLNFFGQWLMSPSVPLGSMLAELIVNRRESVDLEMIVHTAQRSKKYIGTKVTYDLVNDHFALGLIDLTQEKLSLEHARKLSAELEKTVEKRTVELQNVNALLQQQASERQRITAALRDNYLSMTDSIIAAKSIQQLMLPRSEELSKCFASHFIYFQPKDIVSGDFYWFYTHGQKCWLVVADCVGHGVPGAFMSMISSKILNQIVIENKTESSAMILEELDEYVIKEMKQHERSTQVSTGMDISLCFFDFERQLLQYSGAFHNLILERGGKQRSFAGNRFPIGGTFNQNKQFNEHIISFEKGDRFYMFTDGIPDQFGGERNKKFGKRRIREVLHDIQHIPLNKQHDEVAENILDWKQHHEQVDDMLLLGIEI